VQRGSVWGSLGSWGACPGGVRPRAGARGGAGRTGAPAAAGALLGVGPWGSVRGGFGERRGPGGAAFHSGRRTPRNRPESAGEIGVRSPGGCGGRKTGGPRVGAQGCATGGEPRKVPPGGLAGAGERRRSGGPRRGQPGAHQAPGAAWRSCLVRGFLGAPHGDVCGAALPRESRTGAGPPQRSGPDLGRVESRTERKTTLAFRMRSSSAVPRSTNPGGTRDKQAFRPWSAGISRPWSLFSDRSEPRGSRAAGQ
jgi:hypothetical protein